MTYEPLHHKYRPQTFADLVGQEAIATTLTNAIRTERIAPAYLFTGSRGTGKTSSARILAKSLNCLKSNKPIEQPCGVCDVCKGIAKGSTLDVIEIDAASNTGVDNIRELIEKAQFAPVQCRYKVYVIDECLTGDSLVQTSEGLMRIDDPNIKRKKVLSYNETLGVWEFKKVLRWLDQGERQTLIIKTTNREIRCTGNHLIRTEQGWIPAKNVKEGAKILSPVSVDASASFTNLGWMDVPEDLSEDTSSKGIHTGKSHTPLPLSLNRLNTFGHSGKADVEKSLICFIHKDSRLNKIKLLPIGIGRGCGTPPQPRDWAIQQKRFTAEGTVTKLTTTSAWAQTTLENGWQTPTSIQSPQWITNLEQVESVKIGEFERVYDIEVEDNHNFVANGLCLHNCHMLSSAAFNALLKTLEEPPNRVVFVLATTDPQRVLPTIISRCQKFDFRRIPIEAMVGHLKKIARAENITITDEAMTLVAQVAQGGLRDAESLLDQLSLLAGEVTVERVWDLVGAVPERDLMELLRAIAANNASAVLEKARNLMDRGREPLIVLQNLAGFYRDLLIAKTSPSRNDMVAVTSPTWTAMCEFVKDLDTATILKGQKHLKDSEVQIKNTTQPRLWLEVTLLGLLPSADVVGRREDDSVTLIDLKTPQKNPPEPSRHSTTHQQLPGNEAALKPKEATNRVSPAQPTPQEDISKAAPAPVPPENPQPTPPVAQPAASYKAEAPKPLEAESQVQEQQPDLAQIWQKLLAHLPLPSRALFSEHGRLLALNTHEARVVIRAPKLVKIAHTKLADIEVAFLKAFNQKVRVHLAPLEPSGTETAAATVSRPKSANDCESVVDSLEVGSPYSADAHSTKAKQQEVRGIGKSPSTGSSLPSSPEVKEEVRNYSAAPTSTQVPSKVQPQTGIPKASSTAEPIPPPAQQPAQAPRPAWGNDERVRSQPVGEDEAHKGKRGDRNFLVGEAESFEESSPSPRVCVSSFQSQSTTSNYTRDEVAIAAKSFADFFKAEIINLTDDFDKNAEPCLLVPETAATHRGQTEEMIAPAAGLEPDTGGTSWPIDDDEPF